MPSCFNLFNPCTWKRGSPEERVARTVQGRSSCISTDFKRNEEPAPEGSQTVEWTGRGLLLLDALIFKLDATYRQLQPALQAIFKAINIKKYGSFVRANWILWAGWLRLSEPERWFASFVLHFWSVCNRTPVDSRRVRYGTVVFSSAKRNILWKSYTVMGSFANHLISFIPASCTTYLDWSDSVKHVSLASLFRLRLSSSDFEEGLRGVEVSHL